MPLEKADITAMRQALTVVVGGTKDTGHFLLEKAAKAGSVWEGTPQRKIIVAVEGNHDERFAAVFAAELAKAWESFALEVRAGDELVLVVKKGYGSNDYTRAAGVEVDVIGVKTIRTSTKGKVKELYRHLVIGAATQDSYRIVDNPVED